MKTKSIGLRGYRHSPELLLIVHRSFLPQASVWLAHALLPRTRQMMVAIPEEEDSQNSGLNPTELSELSILQTPTTGWFFSGLAPAGCFVLIGYSGGSGPWVKGGEGGKGIGLKRIKGGLGARARVYKKTCKLLLQHSFNKLPLSCGLMYAVSPREANKTLPSPRSVSQLFVTLQAQQAPKTPLGTPVSGLLARACGTLLACHPTGN